jgi:anti-sigma B factor antagonist
MSDGERVDGLAVRTAPGDGNMVMSLEGELDLVSAPRLRDALAAVNGANLDELVLDLADLTYIDSVGIGLLVASRRRLESEGCGFALRNPGPSVRRLLEITGLEEYLGLRG